MPGRDESGRGEPWSSVSVQTLSRQTFQINMSAPRKKQARLRSWGPRPAPPLAPKQRSYECLRKQGSRLPSLTLTGCCPCSAAGWPVPCRAAVALPDPRSHSLHCHVLSGDVIPFCMRSIILVGWNMFILAYG